jgi:deoxyinosine 3'endonuclease (endonuclease V)
MSHTGKAVQFSISKARKAQIILAQKAVTEDGQLGETKHFAGVDAAYIGDWAFGAATVLAHPDIILVDGHGRALPFKLRVSPVTLESHWENPR